MLLVKNAMAMAVAFCLVALPELSVAEETVAGNTVMMSNKWLINGSVETLTFDEVVATEQFVDSSALSFNLEGEYFFNEKISSAVGFGFIHYDDNNGFSQQTESVFGGGQETSESSAVGIPFYFDAGYTRFSGTELPAYVTLRGGYSYMVESERSIGNCSDCKTQDIEIDGGAYALAGAGLNLFRSFSLGVYYKRYFSGDMDDAVGLMLSFGSFRSN